VGASRNDSQKTGPGQLFTDEMTGFGSSMKESIGRKRLAEAMTEYFQEMRQVLESHPANSQ